MTKILTRGTAPYRIEISQGRTSQQSGEDPIWELYGRLAILGLLQDFSRENCPHNAAMTNATDRVRRGAPVLEARAKAGVGASYKGASS